MISIMSISVSFSVDLIKQCKLVIILLFLNSFCVNQALPTQRKLGGISIECGNVFLTVSSLWNPPPAGHGLKDSPIELNWDADCDDDNLPDWSKPNWIGLFKSDPINNLNITPIVRINTSDYNSGYYKTNITFGRVLFPIGWNKEPLITRGDDINDDYVPHSVQNLVTGPQCLPFWIASFNNQTLLKASCLKIQPTWMFDHRNHLGDLKLRSLFLPGTHNSGCYYKTSSARRLDAFNRYILTQDRDIWSQLVYGIRYLDFRVGYYASPYSSVSHSNMDDSNSTNSSSIYSSYKLVNTLKNYAWTVVEHVLRLYNKIFGKSVDELWINHDVLRVTPLLPLIRDLRRFLEVSKGEIVILDFHRFPVGFRNHPERHKILLELLQKELGHLIVPPLFNFDNAPTLNDIWATEKQLIITYGDDDIVKETKWLWSSLPQAWGDKQTVHELKTYLQQTMLNPPINRRSSMWAAMAQLTPTTIDVLKSGSLRQMADLVNRNLTEWARTKWWRLANIVATDFFLGNNLIDIAINSNVYKGKNL